MMRVLETVKEYIDGIECYHFTARDEEKQNFLKDFCKKNKLMISGGSDFHTTDKSNKRSLLNRLNVPEEYFDAIDKKLQEKKTTRF